MTDELPESEVDFGVSPELSTNAWMCRPCERYKYQYNDCKSIKARVHQYFIFGEPIDCSHWRRDFDNCLMFRKTKDETYLQKVIESETNQREDRLRTARMNDVWTYRREPPKDWLKPLPQWFEQQNRFSYLSRNRNNLKEEKN